MSSDGVGDEESQEGQGDEESQGSQRDEESQGSQRDEADLDSSPDESSANPRDTSSDEPSEGTPAESDGAPSDESGTEAETESARDSTGESDVFEFETYYELLGVQPDVSREKIERAYRTLAKRHHPDASERPDREAEQRFRQLLTARDVLTNIERRRAYDALGHAEYRRQSESLGEPVRRADVDRPAEDDASPEPRPEPGRVQRSARGDAHRRGDPVVTSAAEAFAGGPAAQAATRQRAESDATGHEQASGRGIYGLVFEDGPLESRSLQYVGTRWAASWRNRAVVGIGSVLLVAAVLAVLPAVLDTIGVDASVPAATASRLYGVVLVTILAYTGYSCGLAEGQLPRGQFLADRDHGRFTAATSRTYQRRGVMALTLVLVLAVASANTGARPWTHTADALRGDLSGPFPWFDTPAALAGWTTALDALVTGVFTLAAVSGALALSLGVSIALWRARYERGVHARPSFWEPVFGLTLVSTVFALATGPMGLVSLAPLSALPGTVATAAGIDGTTVTVATVAVAGVVLSLASVPLVRLRLALASSEGTRAERGEGTQVEGSEGVRAEGSEGVRAEGSEGVRAEGSEGVRAEGSDGVRTEGSEGVRTEGSEGVRVEGNETDTAVSE